MGAFSSAFSPAAFSVAVVAPPADTTAPAWPAGAAIEVAGLGFYGYSFSASAAANDNAAVTGYRYRLNAGAWTSLTDPASTVSGRTPGSTDALELQALDAAGNASASLAASITLQALPQPGSGLITLEQARAYLASLGVDVPDDMLEDALATVATAVPAMQAAGYDGPTMRRVQRMAVALVAAPGGPRRVQSQGAPSGASRSFKYGDQDFSALRRSLRALDRAGTVAQIVGPDPVGVALLWVL